MFPYDSIVFPCIQFKLLSVTFFFLILKIASTVCLQCDATEPTARLWQPNVMAIKGYGNQRLWQPKVMAINQSRSTK
jgi:hypothetical protein